MRKGSVGIFLIILSISWGVIFGFQGKENSGPKTERVSAQNMVDQAFQKLQNEDWGEAIPLFEKAAEQFIENQEFEEYIVCLNRLAECKLSNDIAGPDFENQLKENLKLCQEKLGASTIETAEAYFNLGFYFQIRKMTNLSIENHQKSIDLKLALLGEDHASLAKSYRQFGRLYRSIGRHDLAILYHRMAISINSSQAKINHKTLSRNYSDLGQSFLPVGLLDSVEKYLVLSSGEENIAMGNKATTQKGDNYYYLGALNQEVGDIPKAITFFDSCYAVYDKVNVSPIRKGHAIRRLAECYLSSGDVYKAKEYFQRNYELIRDNYPEDSDINFGYCYNNLAAVYNHLGEFENGYIYLKKSLNVYKSIIANNNPSDQVLYIPYVNLCEILLKMERHQDAIGYLQLARSTIAAGTANLDKVAYCYILEGIYWSKVRNYSFAEAKFKNALEVYSEINSAGPLHLQGIQELGDLFVRTRQYEKALPVFDSGLRRVMTLPMTDSISKELLDNITDLRSAFFLFSGKGAALQGLGRDTDALSHFLFSLDALDKLRSNFQAENSKIVTSSNAYPIYEQAINLALKLFRQTGDSHYFDLAFTLSERSKALVLLESVSAKKAMRYAGVPDSLVQREQTIDIETAYYERKLREAQTAPSPDPQIIRQMSDRVFEGKKEKTELNNQMKTRYPDYYRLRYSFNIAKPGEIQAEALGNDRALIEYFLGDTTLVLFGLLKDRDTVVSLRIDTSYRSRLLEFQRLVANCDLTNESYHRFCRESFDLYSHLIKPLEKFTGKRRLTLIPDGALGYLSFDALLTAKVDSARGQQYTRLPYLLRRNAISYDYSATLMMEKKKQESRQQTGTYLALAPNFGAELPPLPGAENFVRELSSKFGNGTALVGAEATKERFMREAPSADVIHLATHAMLDDVQPMFSHFIFSSTDENGKVISDPLYTYELYGLQLNAKLAILDGCSTGGGKLMRGEGVMSIARAFSYIGCPAIVMTLWEESDNKSTPVIMRGFFDAMSNGEELDLAMQKAKLAYLDGAGKSNLAHPGLWSELVVIGKLTPVKLQARSAGLLWWASLGLAGAGALFFAYAWKRRAA